MSEKKPTVASLSQVLAEMIERAKELQIQIEDLQVAEQDQNRINDLHAKRMNRLAETDETVDQYLRQTHGQLQRLQAHCETSFVTEKTFREEMERQGRAQDEAVRQAFLAMQNDLRNAWAVKSSTAASEFARLAGEFRGTKEPMVKNYEHLAERLDLLYEKVFAPTWRDRLGEMWWRATHWRQMREADNGIRE